MPILHGGEIFSGYSNNIKVEGEMATCLHCGTIYLISEPKKHTLDRNLLKYDSKVKTTLPSTASQLLPLIIISALIYLVLIIVFVT